MTQIAARVGALLLSLHGWPVYAVIGLLAFTEAAVFVGLVVPGETGLVLGGVLAAQGRLDLAVLVPVGIRAAIAGDSVGYAVGRKMGPGLRRSRLGRRIGAPRWDRAEAALRRRGPVAVVAGRFVAVLRALVPAVAGAARMPYRQFLPANAIGGALWATGAAYVGYLAAGSWQHARALLGVWGATGAALMVLTAVLAARRRRPA
jgi:membrane protein DedA with SNARE-associated domain